MKGSTHRPRLRAAAFLAACALAFASGAARANGLEQPGDSADRYQVFFGGPQSHESSALVGQWRAIDRAIDYESRLLTSGPVNYEAGAIGYSGPAGISYFTPRVTGVDVGFGLSGMAPEGKSPDEISVGSQFGRNWRLGGSVGTSTIRFGAAFGDHMDPTCRDSESCKTNDFWDIGVAWRFGSGALSAGYTSSQRRASGLEDPETLGIFSVSAGYRIAPGLDVFGGIDWIELPATEGPQDQPRNTRFMLGTNLRF